jgi:hypothetical protein
MKISLSPTWKLSTDYAAPSYGQLVLVNRTTGEAFGPGDLVKPYPSYGLMPAAEAVRRLAKTKKLNEEGRDMVARFIKGTKGDERQ